MKKFLKFKSKVIIIAISMIALSCNLDDDDTIPTPDTTLAGLIEDASDLSQLFAALERANLTSVLEGTGPYTLLAPSNTAFTNYMSTNGYANVDAIPLATLQQLLRNHIVASALVDTAPLINLQQNYLETMADGPTTDSKLVLYFDASDQSNIIFNGVSTITNADNPASNGLYHVVDQVIELPTLDTFLSIDTNFADMDTALAVVSPLSDLPSMLSDDDGPFTLFSPSEEAFSDLLDSNADWTFISDIDETLLTSIVEHHAVNGNIKSTDISGGNTATTFEGDDITFSTIDGDLGITDGEGNEGIIIEITDIQAINGVVHIIDQVLMPDTSN